MLMVASLATASAEGRPGWYMWFTNISTLLWIRRSPSTIQNSARLYSLILTYPRYAAFSSAIISSLLHLKLWNKCMLMCCSLHISVSISVPLILLADLCKSQISNIILLIRLRFSWLHKAYGHVKANPVGYLKSTATSEKKIYGERNPSHTRTNRSVFLKLHSTLHPISHEKVFYL